MSFHSVYGILTTVEGMTRCAKKRLFILGIPTNCLPKNTPEKCTSRTSRLFSAQNCTKTQFFTNIKNSFTQSLAQTLEEEGYCDSRQNYRGQREAYQNGAKY